jgi:ABC-type lipoprotein release transport system permease subunit
VILLRIALRNLATHKVKSAIVGGLLVFGTVLLVVGQALLGSLDQSMAQSITGSLSGQLQAYASDAKDKLALFGDMSGGTDIGQITRFGEIRTVLEAQPEVQAVVPMGIDAAMVYGGNILDLKLEALRQAHKTGDATRSRELRAHLRRIVALLAQDLAKMGEVRHRDPRGHRRRAARGQ